MIESKHAQDESEPVWLYIASDLSLRLHGMQSFHGYPLVIRTGGLLNALGPQVGRKVCHPETGQITISCPGFNQKNRYDRETPAIRTFCARWPVQHRPRP